MAREHGLVNGLLWGRTKVGDVVGHFQGALDAQQRSLYDLWLLLGEKDRAAVSEIEMGIEISQILSTARERVLSGTTPEITMTAGGLDNWFEITSKRIDAFSNLGDRIIWRGQNHVEQLASEAQRSLFKLGIIFLLGFLTGAVLLSRINQRLLALRGIARGLSSLARGEPQAIGHQSSGSDEVGVLERAYLDLAASSNELLELATEVASGQLHVELQPRGEKDLLTWALNGMLADLRTAANARDEHNRELRKADRHKSEFLSSVSHELRTPLNSMLILSDILAKNADGNLHDDEVRAAEVINRSTRDLNRIVNDILDMSKVEAGKIDLQWSEIRLSDFLQSVEGLFSPVATQKGLAFEFKASSDIPEFIYTDAGRLAQVLKNLLGNSFKFTRHGGVFVNIETFTQPVYQGDGITAEQTEPRTELQTEAQTEPMLSFTVRDTGVGIPEDKQSDVFEAFSQASTGTSKVFGGTGLGLTIALRFGALLGGALVLEKSSVEGTTFVLRLPVRPRHAGDDFHLGHHAPH